MEYCESNREGNWESSVRVSVGKEFEELGMYLEEREGRKRKWGREEERRAPPKKIMAANANGDMGGSGTSSSSSHMSPGWQDIDLDLPGELSMNEALLSLAVFKQEAPSPTGNNVLSPPRRAWPRRDDRQITNMAVDGPPREAMEEAVCQQSPAHPNMMQQHADNNMQCAPMQQNNMLNMSGYQHDTTHDNKTDNNMQCAPMQQTNMLNMSGLHPDTTHDNKMGGGLLVACSPASSLEGYLHSPLSTRQEPSFKDDTRFQYVLAAATSIATKTNEETLTYLNQGQPYEIKLKKLGDLSQYKGKVLKSIIKICFHERRLQYMEREQIAQWHADRPTERIVEVDVPLSYGVIKVQHPPSLNALHVYWDPFKDVGVYIKVNCISTEFTAKKHGGEKGVPFRIQVETSLASDEDTRLHAAACQIKVFKLKGADRKHKQDREKVMRRPRADLEKYQPGCEATVLTTLSNDAILPPASLLGNSPPYSPEMCGPPKTSDSPVMGKPMLSQPALLPSPNQMKPIYCQDGGDMKVSSPPCHSPGAILPDLPPPPPAHAAADDVDKNAGLSKEATAAETQAWLAAQRFQQHASTFNNFAGADLLRLSRDDLIQICGLADGIRLYNALHAASIRPRLTLYVCAGAAAAPPLYQALYLHACKATELGGKLRALVQPGNGKDNDNVLVSGPNGARVRLTDELVRHLPDNATYRLEQGEDSALILRCTSQ